MPMLNGFGIKAWRQWVNNNEAGILSRLTFTGSFDAEGKIEILRYVCCEM
jgi:hypothetical protein